ncbi:MAG: hypothetical protein PHO20_04885, partial [Candidatus Peribacteraceae bacterium]|nr:hypothetical protein [Candidatus Peribacteraceae bacterium]
GTRETHASRLLFVVALAIQYSISSSAPRIKATIEEIEECPLILAGDFGGFFRCAHVASVCRIKCALRSVHEILCSMRTAVNSSSLSRKSNPFYFQIIRIGCHIPCLSELTFKRLHTTIVSRKRE